LFFHGSSYLPIFFLNRHFLTFLMFSFFQDVFYVSIFFHPKDQFSPSASDIHIVFRFRQSIKNPPFPPKKKKISPPPKKFQNKINFQKLKYIIFLPSVSRLLLFKLGKGHSFGLVLRTSFGKSNFTSSSWDEYLLIFFFFFAFTFFHKCCAKSTCLAETCNVIWLAKI